jgi:hypothetical protein
MIAQLGGGRVQRRPWTGPAFPTLYRRPTGCPNPALTPHLTGRLQVADGKHQLPGAVPLRSPAR